MLHSKSEQRPTRKVYSAPRRFDLATMFVVTITYSLLFGILTAFEISTQWTVSIAGFLSAIGISQAMLFRGKSPRLASVIAGGIALPVIVGLTANEPEPELFVLLMFLNIPFGLAIGYLSGALVGGVFMVAEWLRSGRGKLV